MSEADEAPESVQAARDAAVVRLLMRRTRQDALGVVAALADRGLSPVLLKGIATRELLYPTEARTSSDVDLLAAPGELRACGRALADLGYAKWREDGHASSWTAPGHLPIDLHRTLPRCQVSARRVWRALADHRTTIAIDGSEVTVLDRPAMAVHLAIHLTQTSGERQLEDVRRAVALLSPEDWTAAATLAGHLGTVTSLSWALDQVQGGAEIREALGLAAVSKADLPVRKPLEAGIARFLTSPVHWRERAAALTSTAKRLTTQQSLASWAVAHQRPVPTTAAAATMTVFARVWHYLRTGRSPSPAESCEPAP